MPWPSWLSFSSAKDDKKSDSFALPASLTSSSADSPIHFTAAQTVAASVATTATTLALLSFYKTYVRRIPNVTHLKPSSLRSRSLFGYVTRVGDADNFHLYHTPGGRLMGWGWLPGRRVQNLSDKDVRGKTVHVRIAGVDAPELAHFGRPEQPFAREAIEWLRDFIGGRWVRVYPYREDQYKRVVCSVYHRRWGVWKTDVGLVMLKRGLATVYEAKFGSEFGNKEDIYRKAEERAKKRGQGMWKDSGLVQRILGKGKKEELESPRAYKTRMAKEEKEKEKS